VTPLIVSIDGPAGTGKSTVARGVARRLGLPHLDTGAFYRAATLIALREGIDVEDGSAIAGAVRDSNLDLGDGFMYLDGEDISAAIRGPDINSAVSAVSSHRQVRERLVAEQRRWVQTHGASAVVDGRDVGSVVFPDAEVKIYLHARPEVRAARRAIETGQDPALVLIEQERRDAFDSTRADSPLVVPEGAHVIDTNDLDIEGVIQRIVALVDDESR